VVGGDRVRDDRVSVALDELGPDERVASLEFAGPRLADVVKKAGALGDVGSSPASLAMIEARKAASIEWSSTFWLREKRLLAAAEGLMISGWRPLI